MHLSFFKEKKAITTLILAFLLFATPTPFFASIIKFPPSGEKTVTYQELICTDQDKANIYEIITTLADNGKLSLLLKSGHLKQLGAQINHVHPLKFMSTIFSNPRLRMCMPDIFNDYFKRNGFMDGLGPSLERESDKGKLEQYITDFAAELNVMPDGLRDFFKARDWENLVRHLMMQP